MITPVLILLWLDTYKTGGIPGIWSVPVVTLAGIVVAGELMTMLRERTPGAIPWVTYLGVVLCHLAVIFPVWFAAGRVLDLRWMVFALTVTVMAAFANELFRFKEGRPSTTHIALSFFVVLYAGWLLSFVSAVRLQTSWNAKGVVALFSLMFIIKMSDAGAYFAGKNLGKNKLAPVLSPGKTIEGLIGGIIAAIFAAWIVFAFCYPTVPPAMMAVSPPSWLAVIGYAISICLVGVVGDLAESLIKRDMGVKDSSGWLPGLGGIMDTADSVLLAAPVAYLWWTSGLL